MSKTNSEASLQIIFLLIQKYFLSQNKLFKKEEYIWLVTEKIQKKIEKFLSGKRISKRQSHEKAKKYKKLKSNALAARRRKTVRVCLTQVTLSRHFEFIFWVTAILVGSKSSWCFEFSFCHNFCHMCQVSDTHWCWQGISGSIDDFYKIY